MSECSDGVTNTQHPSISAVAIVTSAGAYRCEIAVTATHDDCIVKTSMNEDYASK